MCIEGIRDDTSDIREPDVPGEEVLNGDLIGGRENGGAAAAAPAGLEREGEACFVSGRPKFNVPISLRSSLGTDVPRRRSGYVSAH